MDWQNSRRSKLLDALAGQPLAHVNILLKRLALYDTGAEATGEGVTVSPGQLLLLVNRWRTIESLPSAVGVGDGISGELADGELLDLNITVV